MELESSAVPPGFRFHPTEEELVGYYLSRKMNSEKIDLDVITDIDLYRIEPWEIQDKCKLGYEEQNEWYFFSHKDKKYPTGTRTNRATTAGFWKATGRDKAVLSKQRIIGMRKTLVFYKGRAPNGKKTDWIMHEYRLQTSEHGPPQDEGWVVCRAFKKPTPSHIQGYEAWNHAYYLKAANNHAGIRSFGDNSSSSSMQISDSNYNRHQGVNSQRQYLGYDQEQGIISNNTTTFMDEQYHNMELPQLDSPSMSTSLVTTREGLDIHDNNIRSNFSGDNERNNYEGVQFVDWKALDKLLASQLSETTSSLNADVSMTPQKYDLNNYCNEGNCFGDYFPDL